MPKRKTLDPLEVRRRVKEEVAASSDKTLRLRGSGDAVKIPKKDWRWFGNAGHFIAGQWCRFHLCTQIGSHLISTVGEYVHPRHGKGTELGGAHWLKKNWPGEEIGFNRFYETMVFEVGPPCTAEGCNCGLPALASAEELDFKGYKTAEEATAGHLAMCKKWADL